MTIFPDIVGRTLVFLEPLPRLHGVVGSRRSRAARFVVTQHQAWYYPPVQDVPHPRKRRSTVLGSPNFPRYPHLVDRKGGPSGWVLV